MDAGDGDGLGALSADGAMTDGDGHEVARDADGVARLYSSEVAESIAYLASDAARSVTGTALVVDLGVVA